MAKENIIRDLKGIILGIEYTIKDGQIIEKNKTSIVKKIEYVKRNILSLGVKYDFNSSHITDFKGIIITMDHPPISEFHGIKILSISQISGL
jgi:hypothetical protein